MICLLHEGSAYSIFTINLIRRDTIFTLNSIRRFILHLLNTSRWWVAAWPTLPGWFGHLFLFFFLSFIYQFLLLQTSLQPERSTFIYIYEIAHVWLLTEERLITFHFIIWVYWFIGFLALQLLCVGLNNTLVVLVGVELVI